MSLQLHTAAPHLFRLLLRIPSYSKVFIPTLHSDQPPYTDPGNSVSNFIAEEKARKEKRKSYGSYYDTEPPLDKPTTPPVPSILEPFVMSGHYVSAISTRSTPYIEHNNHPHLTDYSANSRIEAAVYPKPFMVTPRESFHFAFAFPMLQDDLTPHSKEDVLRDYQASVHDPNRFAPEHFMLLEQMFNAVMPAGYFGAILQRRWIGSAMKHMKWWNENVALVARIALPSSTIERIIHTTEEQFYEFARNKGFQTWTADKLNPLPEYCRAVRGSNVSTGKSASDFMLFIWQKPVDPDNTKRNNKLFFATQRFSAFVGKLKDYNEKQTEKLARQFWKHDWGRLSVKRFNKVLSESGSFGGGAYSAEQYDNPVILKTPKDLRILKVGLKSKPSYQIADTIEEIKSNPLAVHIKIGPPVKLYTYNHAAYAILHDTKLRSGITTEETKRFQAAESKSDMSGVVVNGNNNDTQQRPQFEYVVKVKGKSFIENKEWLLKTLQEAGLVPYLLTNEVQRLKKHERWLNVQLAPVERVIKVSGSGVPVTASLEEKEAEELRKKEKESGHMEDSGKKEDTSTLTAVQPEYQEPAGYQENWSENAGEEWKQGATDQELSSGKSENSEEKNRKEELEKEKNEELKEELEQKWETLYDDVSIKAAYPELWNLWVRRAEKMKMDNDNISYGFQFEDIITSVCKQSIVNGNVMGLGKTREALLAVLLRGARRSLFIIPTRLIGVWQEEIETVIANYVRRVRRNWMGQPMYADYQVIQWARDCKRENLKTFNLIAYESLARVPKDSKFYVCLVCKFVVCSHAAKGPTEQLCPECNKNSKKKWKESNIRAGLKKFKLEGGKVEDDRFMIPGRIIMQEVTKMHDKVSRKIIKISVRNALTGDFEIQNHVKEELRKPHLKWTFSNLLRYLFNTVTIDEANYINNPKAQRTQALNNVTGRTRRAMTGTLIHGYPKSVVSVLNWAFKRSVFPDYRSPGRSDFGQRKFEKKYATYIEREGLPPKIVPKINNAELFQAELAPLTIRHLRHEPNVAKYVPPKTPVIDNIIVPMDHEHRAYYQKWLEVFAEWWRLKRIEEDKQEDAKSKHDLLVKFGYLFNASSIPHLMLANLEGSKDEQMRMWAKLIEVYKGKQLVSKFKKCCELIKYNIEQGDKTIVFASRVANLQLGRAWCAAQHPKINSIQIDGTVSNKIDPTTNRSPKQMRVDKFRFGDYHVLWAGIKTMREGFNIEQANRGIMLDTTWVDNDWKQGLGRMLRPAQKKTVHCTFLMHEGSVEEYQAAYVQLKGLSADEGLDYKIFDTFGSHLIPDFTQYANSIVDGKEKELKRKMWCLLDELKKLKDEDDD